MLLAAAQALSLGRLGLAAFVLVELAGATISHWVFPAVVLAALSDFLDGRVARAYGPVSATGRWLDTLCDVAFLAACFAGFAWVGAFAPALATLGWGWLTAHGGSLPLWALAFSFGSYATRWAVCAAWRCPAAPSPIGHWAGIANYGLALVSAFAVYPGTAVDSLAIGAALSATLTINLAAGIQNLVLLARAAAARR